MVPLIAEAVALGAAPQLRIDAVKALQQRWQAEAQSVPLERRQEQKLWDAFRAPIDEAFNRKSAEREKASAAVSEHDRQVLAASKALDAANATGDAQNYLAEYKVRAEVQNRREGNFWLVRPGMPANLTIHVSQPAVETAGAVSKR